MSARTNHRHNPEVVIQQARHAASSLRDFAGLLNVSTPTAYRYIKKHNLPPFDSVTADATHNRSVEAYEMFHDRTSLIDLSSKLQVSRGMVRYLLEKYLIFCWSSSLAAKDFPIPARLGEIKIVHLLQCDPSLFDNAEAVCDRTDLPRVIVEHYLQRTYDFRTKPTSSRKGKRAIT